MFLGTAIILMDDGSDILIKTELEAPYTCQVMPNAMAMVRHSLGKLRTHIDGASESERFWVKRSMIQSLWHLLASIVQCQIPLNVQINQHVFHHRYMHQSLHPTKIITYHANTVVWSCSVMISRGSIALERLKLGPQNRVAAASLDLYMDTQFTIPKCSALGAAFIERTFGSQYETTFLFANFKQEPRLDFVTHHN